MGREMIEDPFVNQAAPELREQMEQIDAALQTLHFAASSFRTATEELRVIDAEDRAEAYARTVADAAFAKALGAAPAE